ncbi:MAG: aspartate--tRNA ligase, partial [Lachnospiraceae bacterium]|nr:aspartate--tRNA ligase [Lachnospiraceae bacterium]
RLQYRYLDLRRADLQKNFILRHRVTTLTRQFLANEGFIDIETPVLCKSTPEGARDYLVPSRVHPGSFYALPQSPQIFKQLLMCSGFDRYMQIAKCFRDEDLRADRQPEFTQIDLEMSFVDVDDVIDVNSRLLVYLFKEIMDYDVPYPIPRMTWQEAMDRYGSDKPDLRFGMELIDLSDTIKGCGFGVFENAVKEGGSVRALCAKGAGDMSRKKLDKLVTFVRDYGAGGLAYIQIAEEGTRKVSFGKFVSDETVDAIVRTCDAGNGDLILICSGTNKVVWDSLGALRVHLAKQLELIPEGVFKFVWVVDFPQFEWSDEEGRFMAMHHPFTMPYEEDIQYLKSDPARVRAKAYDIVLNGTELGGGSVRISRPDVQETMFEALGFTPEEAYERFGFLLDAFRYGVPPHAGLAYGLDRMIMLMCGCDSIRDCIAFPKVKDASDLMSKCPSAVDDKQLEELGIALREAPSEE